MTVLHLDDVIFMHMNVIAKGVAMANVNKGRIIVFERAGAETMTGNQINTSC